MKADIQYIIQNPDADSGLIQMKKDRLGKSVFISILMIVVVWWMMVRFFKLFVPDMTAVVNIVLLLLVLIAFYFANIFYMGFYYQTWDFMPFTGFVELAKNFNLIYDIVGIPSFSANLSLINQTGVL